jgi:hypothetical protein
VTPAGAHPFDARCEGWSSEVGDLDELTIERRGGLAGLSARAEIQISSLAPADQSAIRALFAAKQPFPPSPGADRFTYAITTKVAGKTRTIDVPEHLMPPAVAALVKLQLP